MKSLEICVLFASSHHCARRVVNEKNYNRWKDVSTHFCVILSTFPQSSKVDFTLWREHTCESTRRLCGSKRRLHERASLIKRSNAIFTPENLQAAIVPAWFPTYDQATHHWIIKSKAGESISKPESKSKGNLNNLSGISSPWPFCAFL